MKIKILTGLSGLDFSYCAGEEIEMLDEEALLWIDGGVAEAIPDTTVTSTKKS